MRYLLAILLVLCLSAPAWGENWIRDNFHLVDFDESGTTMYLGYQNENGGWYIKAIDESTTDIMRFSYSYVSTNTDYSHHWANRATLSGASRYQTLEDAF
jgi:hypothetical protein